RIALVKCVDEKGADSDKTLFWGYLSSKNVTSIHGSGVLDQAIVEHKEKTGTIDIKGWEKVAEIPFDSERRMESIVMKKESDTMLITKGAPEDILKAANTYGEKAQKLTATARAAINKQYESLSNEGFRVLGLGIKKVPLRASYGKADEAGMSFMGFLAFLDPPKKTVKETLKKMAAYNVAIKIITGDNFLVTKHIAEEIGLSVVEPLTGDDLAKLDEHQFKVKVEKTNVFTRVTPEQKEAIIRALRGNGHVVAYMGDGVNDVLSIKEADVGISVNNAVDVAKETADIILLHRGLREIIDGVVEGRKTFANTFKYLMMALSSNFGNMFSMPVASIFLPFLPMTAPQILLNNFLYDASQVAIPFDHVENEFLARPKKFDIGFMKKFMIIFGPLSSCFDFLTFVVLLWVLHVTPAGFQTGWFLESIATQTFVVGIIRNRSSFWKTPPSKELATSTILAVAIGWIIPYTFIGIP